MRQAASNTASMPTLLTVYSAHVLTLRWARQQIFEGRVRLECAANESRFEHSKFFSQPLYK